MKIKSLTILFFILILFIAFLGCVSSSDSSTKPVNAKDISKKVDYFQTFSRGYDSNDDGDDESIVINPILKDSEGNTIKTSGINLPLEIVVRNTYTEKGDIIPKYKTDYLYSGRIFVTESPNQKTAINLETINFNSISTYKDSPGVYSFVIDFTLYLPDGRELTYEELVSLNRWKNL